MRRPKPSTLFSVLLGALALATLAPDAASQPTSNVGYQVLDLTHPHGGTLTVAVWYPTAAEAGPFRYGGPTRGQVAPGAPVKTDGAPYPFLVFSHGYGGGGLGAVFFTEALAARGWIVAAPDHHDRHSAVRIRSGHQKDFSRLGLLLDARRIGRSGPGDRPRYRYRLDEMRATLEGLLASERFGRWIDRERIAAGGHSLGGFTALGLAGTLEAYHEPRLKALLLFSTGAGAYLFREEELRRVKIPTMLFLGEREAGRRRGRKTMAELAAMIYGAVSPPKYFLELAGGTHFSFNNRFVENRRARRLSGTEAEFAIIRRFSIAFLETHVRGREDRDHVLERGHPGISRFEREPAASR